MFNQNAKKKALKISHSILNRCGHHIVVALLKPCCNFIKNIQFNLRQELPNTVQRRISFQPLNLLSGRTFYVCAEVDDVL